jgi:hypothetical protein
MGVADAPELGVKKSKRGPYIQFDLSAWGFLAHIARTFILKLEVLNATLFAIFPGTLPLVWYMDIKKYGIIMYSNEKTWYTIWILTVVFIAIVPYASGVGTLPVVLHTTVVSYLFHVMMAVRFYTFEVQTNEHEELEMVREKIRHAKVEQIHNQKTLQEDQLVLENNQRTSIEKLATEAMERNEIPTLRILFAPPFGGLVFFSVPFIGYFLAAIWGFWALSSTPGLDTLDAKTRLRSINIVALSALLVVLGGLQIFILTIPLTVAIGAVISLIIGAHNTPSDFLTPLLVRATKIDPFDGKIISGNDAAEDAASVSLRALGRNLIDHSFRPPTHANGYAKLN